MQAVSIETERRSVEDAAFGDGGMEQTRGRNVLGRVGGFLRTGRVATGGSSRMAPANLIPMVGGNLTSSPLIRLGPATVSVNGVPLGLVEPSGLVPAEPGTTARVLEQKLLEKMVASRFLPPTVRTIADLPAGTRFTKHESVETDNATYEIVLPHGGTFRWEASLSTLQAL